jgi:hypothetical protein
MRTSMPVRFETASGDVRIEGVLVEVRETAARRAASPCASPWRERVADQYATNGDIHLAYRTIGEGPLDLVLIEGAITNLEVLWDVAEYRSYASSSRPFRA